MIRLERVPVPGFGPPPTFASPDKTLAVRIPDPLWESFGRGDAVFVDIAGHDDPAKARLGEAPNLLDEGSITELAALVAGDDMLVDSATLLSVFERMAGLGYTVHFPEGAA